jgi:hypothetical protein
MKLYIRYILPLFLVLGTLTGCTDDLSDEINDNTDSTVRRTVLVYMVAENSLSTYAEDDLNELAYAAGRNMIPSDCNILVYCDNASQPSVRLYNKLGANTWKTYTERNSADSTVMLATLKEMVKNYPSEHYALVLWSHGSGWAPTEKTRQEMENEYRESHNSGARQARAFGIDNGNNSGANGPYGMNISSIKWVLNKLGVHMDYILWDACLMQSIETAYELRQQADWIIGSPTETPGKGAPYDTAAKGLCDADMGAILKAYTDFYNNSNGRINFPLSFIKTSELDALAKATAPLVAKYFADKNATPEGVATAQVYSTRLFAVYDAGAVLITVPISYDMGSVMGQILTEEEYGKWRPLLDKAVPYKTYPTKQWLVDGNREDKLKYSTLTDGEHYSGISMNVPEADYDVYPVTLDKRIYLGWNTYFKKMSWWQAGGWSQSGWNK